MSKHDPQVFETSVGSIEIQVGRLAWIFATPEANRRFYELPDEERNELRSTLGQAVAIKAMS